MANFSIFLLAIFFSIATLVSPLYSAETFTFNPNNIISDFELKDKNSMSLKAIQSFLEEYESPLKDLMFDVNGVQKTVAEIVYEASQTHIISPKFILTKLDHEQCLIRGCEFHTDPQKFQRALDWATGFGLCSGCNVNDPKLAKYKGFANQVDALASVQNEYILKADRSYVYGKGETFTTADGHTITPENQATANLYTYTPYRGDEKRIGGNYFFAKLWQKYWGDLLYPDGVVLQDDRGTYWLLDGGVKRKFASMGAYLASYTIEDAVTVSPSVLEEYQEGLEIKFANYALVRDETGSIYLLVDGRRRKIEGEETFRRLGFNPEGVETVSSAELSYYEVAVPITETEIYPQGGLFQETGTSDIYFVKNGFKYRVYADVAALNFPNINPSPATSDEISKYYEGEPQKVRDGKFVKSGDGALYMVSRGVLRPIASVLDFIELFGESKLNTVKEISQASLALHEIGDPIYASSYERDTGFLKAVSMEPPAVSYRAVWNAIDLPKRFILGKEARVKVSFKNTSGTRWAPRSVSLVAEETGTRAFNEDIILPDGSYAFTLPLVFNSASLHTLTFKLETSGGAYVPGGWYQTTVEVVEPVYKAKIISGNLPVAVRNKWSSVKVAVKIKNEGKEAWTRRKTGLWFLGDAFAPSPFYDKKDWVSREIASVSLSPRKDKILPGETATFEFILNVKGLTAGMYPYRMRLVMSDVKETVYLDGGEFVGGMIRVDN